MNFDKNSLTLITNFLTSIRIEVIDSELKEDTFLPGLKIKEGAILLDRAKLKYTGDLLHEAGHIAVTDSKIRSLIGTAKTPNEWPTDSEEIAAILWSFAASLHLKLDLNVVFHPKGYKNDSAWLIKEFTNKNYIGLPLLEWMALCKKDEFPFMMKWLRD